MEQRIGFIGCYSHDVILLLAKVMECMGKRVLIRDRNRQRTLHASLPVPEPVSVAEAEVEYDGLFFTEQRVLCGEGDYDIELVDFGMHVNKKEVQRCSGVVLVTDMLLHHIRHLEAEAIPKEAVFVCIVRDAFEETCREESEWKHFLQLFPNQTTYFLPPDYRDVRNRYVCETMHEYCVNKASAELRNVIFRLASTFCTTYTEREIRNAVRRRERRRYR